MPRVEPQPGGGDARAPLSQLHGLADGRAPDRGLGEAEAKGVRLPDRDVGETQAQRRVGKEPALRELGPGLAEARHGRAQVGALPLEPGRKGLRIREHLPHPHAVIRHRVRVTKQGEDERQGQQAAGDRDGMTLAKNHPPLAPRGAPEAGRPGIVSAGSVPEALPDEVVDQRRPAPAGSRPAGGFSQAAPQESFRGRDTGFRICGPTQAPLALEFAGATRREADQHQPKERRMSVRAPAVRPTPSALIAQAFTQ